MGAKQTPSGHSQAFISLIKPEAELCEARYAGHQDRDDNRPHDVSRHEQRDRQHQSRTKLWKFLSVSRTTGLCRSFLANQLGQRRILDRELVRCFPVIGNMLSKLSDHKKQQATESQARNTRDPLNHEKCAEGNLGRVCGKQIQRECQYAGVEGKDPGCLRPSVTLCLLRGLLIELEHLEGLIETKSILGIWHSRRSHRLPRPIILQTGQVEGVEIAFRECRALPLAPSHNDGDDRFWHL
jgi:hypothetical protein